MRKKLVSGLLAVSMMTGMLAGCGSGDAATETAASGSAAAGSVSAEAATETTGETVKLTFYCNAVVKNDTPDIIAEFQKEYPNVEVEYVELPADSTKKNQTISTILQAQDDSMDVFLIDTTWPQTYAASGWLEPFDDVMTEEELAAYVQAPLQAANINGSQVALPVFMDTGVLLYRQDLLDKYGYEVPTTIDELVAAAQDISAQEGIAGYVGSWKQYENLTCSALEFIKAYGGDIVDENGEVKIGSAESGEGIQKMYDFIYTDQITDEGINGYTSPDAAAIFDAGNAVFMRGWPSNYVEANNPEIASESVVGNVGVTTLPAGPDGSYSCLGGWSIAVSPYSSHKDEAKAFAKFFSGETGNKIRALAGGNLPVIQSVYEDPEVQEAMPQFEFLKECAANAAARPKSSYYAEISGSLQQGIGSFLTGNATLEEVQEAMQSEIQEIIDREK